MSPVVLFIIVIFALLFFISGLLHFLFRFLAKHSSSSSRSNNGYPEVATSDALQRQLQELFHLHDSGLDQAFIDALPVFMYEDISKVVKEPFDCAVCLCEFSEKDQLRLLPMCGHAFHINCIDTWLLSNSSCPLCRGSLFTPDFSIEYPIFDFDEFRNPQSIVIGSVPRWKSIEIDEVAKQKGLFPVRLGKFRKLGNGDDVADVGETSSSNLDARRCYSMGSYQYVVGDKNLKVALRSVRNKNTNIYTEKHTQKYTDNLGCKMQVICSLDPQHKIQESMAKIGTQASTDNVYLCMNHCPRINHDMKFERGLESNVDRNTDIEGKKLSIGSKTDSYSVSKIWLWTKKNKFASSWNAQ